MTNSELWPMFPLSSLVQVLDKLRVPVNSNARFKRAGGVPYYGATGQVGTIDEALFNEDLLILGEDGVQFFDSNKSKAYKISGPSWVNNHAHVLRPDKNKIVLEYLMHFLNQFNFIGYANGTTRLKLTQGAMNRIPIPLPPIEEQKRIVEILEFHLTHMDTALLDVKKAKLKAAKFSRSYIHELTTEIEGSEVLRILDVCDVYQPKTISTKELISGGEFAVYGANGQIGYYDRYNHENSEVTVTCRGATCGTVNVVPPKTWITGNAMVFTPKDNRIQKGFLEYVLRGVDWVPVITGTAQPQITRTSIQDLYISVPNPGIQQKIHAKLETSLGQVFSASNLGDKVQDQAKSLRRSLLKAAFSGQLTKEVLSV